MKAVSPLRSATAVQDAISFAPRLQLIPPSNHGFSEPEQQSVAGKLRDVQFDVVGTFTWLSQQEAPPASVFMASRGLGLAWRVLSEMWPVYAT